MHRKALESLSAVRPSVSRLDRSRAPAELSADLVEAWSGTETSLRALLGGSMLGGAALIHEARQRQMLTFDQANALAAFCAVAGRCANPSYRPSDNDINSTREGFDQFESSLQMAEGAPAHTSPGEAMSTKGLRLSPLGTPRPVPLPPEDQPWWIVVVASVVVIGALGGIGWYAWSRLSLRSESATMGAAIDLFTEGRTVAARSAFEEIVHRDPADADAHTYLARIARDAGDLKTAREHATLAVQAEPGNPVVQRITRPTRIPITGSIAISSTRTASTDCSSHTPNRGRAKAAC